jgi:pimeloyl-ACP methyl ester carboxylesterase
MNSAAPFDAPPDIAADSWARAACAATKQALLEAHSWRSASGLWSTARTRYDDVELPSSFRIETVDACGARRRIATCPGRPGTGPTLVIVPGLFASLHERLFVEVAAAAAREGRAVCLVEDRFAAPTVSMNGPFVPTAKSLAAELAAILGRFEGPADVLAMSAGALSALFVPAPVRRVVAWSAAFRPTTVLAYARQSFFVRRYFGSLLKKAFAGVRARPPSWVEIVESLDAEEDRRFVDAPLLLIHAEDDPAAPVAEVRRAVSGLRAYQRACIVARGGHLGFGDRIGPEVYLLPFTPGTRASPAAR